MDCGHILSFPPIVENVFKHLSYKDLNSCSEVCELWKTIADTEMKRREDIFWFFLGLRCGKHNKIHSTFRECSLERTKDIEQEVGLLLKDLRINPKYCLIFVTSRFEFCFKQLFPSYGQTQQGKRRRTSCQLPTLKSMCQYITGHYIPKSCPVNFSVSNGIIGCQPDSAPLEIEDHVAMTGIMFPHVTGFELYNFFANGKKTDISDFVPKTTNIKCLIALVTSFEPPHYGKIIESAIIRENSKLAIGGALIDSSTAGRGNFIAFCGDSVDAASAIIHPKDRIPEVNVKLKAFKETGLLEHRCFAFMFACVARGLSVYKDDNAESSVFHKLYPNVPLIGVFGNGEIGFKYLPNVPDENGKNSCEKQVKHKKNYFRSYTTVFVLVALKL